MNLAEEYSAPAEMQYHRDHVAALMSAGRHRTRTRPRRGLVRRHRTEPGLE